MPANTSHGKGKKHVHKFCNVTPWKATTGRAEPEIGGRYWNLYKITLFGCVGHLIMECSAVFCICRVEPSVSVAESYVANYVLLISVLLVL
jgi:hypothetical protein